MKSAPPAPPVLETSLPHGVAQLTINRPHAANAINLAVYRQLTHLLHKHRRLKTTRILVLTAAGSNFCAGMDIREAAAGPRQLRQTIDAARTFMEAVLAFDKPLFAGVFGMVSGIAVTTLMYADFVYASDLCWFETPFVRTGIVCEFGSSVVMERKVGGGMMSRLLIKGERVGVEEMERVGFCRRVEGGRKEVVQRVIRDALEWSASLGDDEWDAVVGSKRLILEGQRVSVWAAVERELAVIKERVADGSASRVMSKRMREIGMSKL